MRFRIYIGLLAVLMCACEVIKEEERLIPLPREEFRTNRTHVLIEYTGFRCVNCPTAAELAQSLVQLYDSQLIVVAMHPASNPFTQGAAKFDYTTPAADVYYQFMHGTKTTPFPIGNIDFTPENEQYLFEPNMWAAQLSRVMNDSTRVSVSVEAEIDTLTRQIAVTTKLFSDTLIDCRLALWLVEDSVLGAQAMPDGTNNMAYYHRHLLRESLDEEAWGKAVFVKGEEEAFSTTHSLPEKYNAQQCHIVAVLMDKEDYHILNAKQTPIKYKEQ